MTGLDTARATANKLKKESAKEKKEVAASKAFEQVEEQSLTVDPVEGHGLAIDPDVAAFYKRNARVGSENISRIALPGLKVTESNSNNELEDGTRSEVGKIFYTATKEEFDSVEVSIMSVSRGYYAEGMKKDDDPKFNQIVSGIILDSMKRFIMYVSGKRLQYLWDFGKELSPFTKHKEMPVPMMAFRVNLSTTPVKHQYGTTHIVNFEIIRDKDNKVQLTTDIGVLEVLRSGIESMEQAVESIIEATEVDKQTGELLKDSYQAESLPEVELAEAQVAEEEDEIPL